MHSPDNRYQAVAREDTDGLLLTITDADGALVQSALLEADEVGLHWQSPHTLVVAVGDEPCYRWSGSFRDHNGDELRTRRLAGRLDRIPVQAFTAYAPEGPYGVGVCEMGAEGIFLSLEDEEQEGQDMCVCSTMIDAPLSTPLEVRWHDDGQSVRVLVDGVACWSWSVGDDEWQAI